MQLRECQLAFLEALTTISPGNQNFINQINSSKTLSAQARLNIYRNSRTEICLKALKRTYLVCLNLVGESNFNTMARQYIGNYFPKYTDLTFVGEKFAQFIANFQPAKRMPYLSDIAQLEWHAYMIYHHTKAPETREIKNFNSLDPEKQQHIVFEITPLCHLIQSKYPIHEIWETHQEGFNDNKHVNIKETPTSLIITKNDKEILVISVSEMEWQLIKLMQQDLNLMAICNYFTKHYPDQVDTLPSLLPKIIQNWVVNWVSPDISTPTPKRHKNLD